MTVARMRARCGPLVLFWYYRRGCHRAYLSRPSARQPSRPCLPIPQLLPPCRRHTCTGGALRRVQVSPTPPASTAVLRHARLQFEPPWGLEPMQRTGAEHSTYGLDCLHSNDMISRMAAGPIIARSWACIAAPMTKPPGSLYCLWLPHIERIERHTSVPFTASAL